MTDCPQIYRNVGNENFGEQIYVRSDVLHQFCKNDAWLRGQVLKLQADSPPIVRKRFNPVQLDLYKSWGCVVASDGTVQFDERNYEGINIDFSKSIPNYIPVAEENPMGEEMIDTSKSETILQSYVTADNTVDKYVTIPPEVESTIDTESTRDYSPFMYETSDGKIVDSLHCNEFWYVGFDKSRHYETRPNWLNDHLNGEIPSVCRAQTFKAKKTGYLIGLTLNIKGSMNTADPLMVQIRRTTQHANSEGKMTYYPVPTWEVPLAHQDVRFTTTNPGIYTVIFENPAYIEQGKTYAICLLSPLSHWTNCYYLGGWSASCGQDYYADGEAFYSWNNGHDWIRYGYADKSVAYHEGANAPRDFAFKCHIRQDKNVYSTGSYTCYFQPIYSSPVRKVKISSYRDGNVTDSNTSIEYYVSNDGRTWHKFDKDLTVDFGEDEDNHRHVTLLKAVLTTNTKSKAPYLQGLNITLFTDTAKEAYARTVEYAPITSGMFSARVWNAFNAPYTADVRTSCDVDVIPNVEEHQEIRVINPYDLYFYIHLWRNDAKMFQKIYNATRNISNVNYEAITRLLAENPSILDTLAENDIFVKGYIGENDTFTVDDNGYQHKMKQMKFIHSPAAPIVDCVYYPMEYNNENEANQPLSEWLDYTVDYETDYITWYDDVANIFNTGYIKFTYTPVFSGGYTNEDMPVDLDIFEEEFIISQEDIENGYITLRAPPLDPIKDVYLEGDVELLEDVDFYMNYDAKTLNFMYDDEPVVNVNDKITVRYVPYLYYDALSLGYHMKREDTTDKIIIKHNWIEYKT